VSLTGYVILFGAGSALSAFAYLLFRIAKAVRALEVLYMARAKRTLR
jgi:hypothetical protein